MSALIHGGREEDWTGCDRVEVVPGRLSGEPLLRGTRMPVRAIIENFDDGMSAEEVAAAWQLDLGDVRAVIALARGCGAGSPR